MTKQGDKLYVAGDITGNRCQALEFLGSQLTRTNKPLEALPALEASLADRRTIFGSSSTTPEGLKFVMPVLSALAACYEKLGRRKRRGNLARP